MKNLQGSNKDNELTRMLRDQLLSIGNIEIHFDEVKPVEKQLGIKRKYLTFNEWMEYINKSVRKSKL